jgi:hypothetical protein
MIDFPSERSLALQNLYSAFDRNLKEDTLSFLLEKTRGVGLEKLIDICRKMEFADELPRNVSREIIMQAGTKSASMVACENCCYYLDDQVETREWGRIPYAPGLRHYRYSEGDIYAKTGHAVPCNCESGRRLLASIQKSTPIKSEVPF